MKAVTKAEGGRRKAEGWFFIVTKAEGLLSVRARPYLDEAFTAQGVAFDRYGMHDSASLPPSAFRLPPSGQS